MSSSTPARRSISRFMVHAAVLGMAFAAVCADTADAASPHTTGTAPTVSFSYSPASVTVGVPVTFTATVTSPDSSSSSVSWDLGSGNFGDATGTTATKTFATAGSYTIRAQATNSDGPGPVSSQTITVVADSAPTVSFSYSPASITAGAPVTFTATAASTDGSPVSSVSWDLNSGNFGDATGTTATKDFLTTGSYTIRVQATNAEGLTAVSSQTITVAPAAGSILSPAVVIKPELRLLAAKVSGDRVKLKLTCAFASCNTTTSLTTAEHKVGGRLTAVTARAAAKTARVKVGSSRIRLAVGKSATYTLKLNGTGLKLLKRFGRLPVTLALSEIKTTRRLTLKQPARKPTKR